MRAAQLEPLPRSAFEWKTAAASAPGSLFRMTQDSQLARVADPTSYPVPPVEYQSVSYSGALYEVPHQRRFLDENAQGYLVYLGGDAALLAAKTNVRNGRRVLLVKNSFGNALAPLLLPHFEQVIVADYRMYFRTVAALVKRFKITDLIVQNATLTANDPYHRGRLKAASALDPAPVSCLVLPFRRPLWQVHRACCDDWSLLPWLSSGWPLATPSEAVPRPNRGSRQPTSSQAGESASSKLASTT